jgi:hypothetical protein
MATKVVFYKTREMNLPTVLFDGDTFYEFLCTSPGVFEHVATSERAVKVLTKHGYQVKGNGEDSPDEKAVPPPPPDGRARKPQSAPQQEE